jgi:hypothetical protein
LLDRYIRDIATHIQRWHEWSLLPLAQVPAFPARHIEHTQALSMYQIFWPREFLNESGFDPVVEATQTFDLGVRLSPFSTTLRHCIVVLCYKLCCVSLLYSLPFFFLSLPSGRFECIALGGTNSRASSGSFELAWW